MSDIDYTPPASSTSFWKEIEFPQLVNNADVTAIWDMADNTEDPYDHDQDLKSNPEPNAQDYAPGT